MNEIFENKLNMYSFNLGYIYKVFQKKKKQLLTWFNK